MVALGFLLPYVTYLSLDLRQYLRTGVYENRPARIVKLVSVVLLALLVWWPAPGAGDVTLLRVAFVFTVIGDVFFSILKRFVAGVAMFAVVQMAYIARHVAGVHASVDEALLFAAPLAVGTVLFLSVRRGLAAKKLSWPVALYIGLSAVSVWMGIAQPMRGIMPIDAAWRVALGISLLAVCDSSIAVRTVLDGHARQRVGLVTWAMYLPALVLLASSGPTVLAW